MQAKMTVQQPTALIDFRRKHFKIGKNFLNTQQKHMKCKHEWNWNGLSPGSESESMLVVIREMKLLHIVWKSDYRSCKFRSFSVKQN